MVSSTDRREALQDLVSLRVPLSSAVAAVRNLPWDSDQELVVLTRADMTRLVEKFLGNAVDPAEVEDWANALESREDVGYEQGFEAAISEVIFQMANPELAAPLDMTVARRWLKAL